MSSKKKLIISMLVVSFVLLSIIATVAIAFALTQQTIKTSLNIGYTVEDIDGTASASYTIGGVTENLTAMKGNNVIGDTLVFKASDTEDAGNLMFPEDALALTAQNDNVVIQYTYSNTGSKHYIASMDFAANIEADNMKVEYSIDGTIYSEQRYAVVVPANTSNRSYWIKISIEDKTKSASFTGDFDWLLSGCDPQSDSYLSMPKLEFQGSAGSYSANISSNSGYVGNLVFPSSVNGDPVTTISANNSLTQAQKNQVTSVYIPDSVTTIGDNAFKGYVNLQTINFEQNEKAGASSQSTTGLTSIGFDAFNGCSSLQEFIMPDTVEYAFDGTFTGTKLRKLVIGKSFCSDAWAYMFPNSYLEEISVAEGNAMYYSINNCIISRSSKTLALGCKTSVIPNDGSVTAIGGASFLGCISLSKLNLPNTITEIGYQAFYGCSNLTNINLPVSLNSIQGESFSCCSSLNSLVIPESVTYIDSFNFEGCKSLKSIEVSSSNTSYKSVNNCLIDVINKTLIRACSSSVIPDDGSVINIGYSAFNGCEGLTSIIIPDCVTHMESSAISSCPDLLSVTIGKGITNIDSYFFSDCKKLNEIIISAENTKYKSSGNCIIDISNKILIKGSNSSVIPSDGSVTQIGSAAFKFCEGLTSIVIPNSVVTINSSAFYGCTNLKNVTFGSNITTINRIAFYKCSSLTSIVIPSSVNKIGDSVFAYCDNLTSITFENPNGWYIASSSSATSGTSVDSVAAAEWVKTNVSNFNSCLKRS